MPLRPRDVNFWEERVTLPGEVVGRQVQTSLEVRCGRVHAGTALGS